MATVKSINPLKPTPGVREQYDQLANKLSQLHALLEMTYGNAGETFNSMSDELRDKFLWHCADVAHDCEALADDMGTRLYQLENAASHG